MTVQSLALCNVEFAIFKGTSSLCVRFYKKNVDGQGTQSINKSLNFKGIKEVLESKFYWNEWLYSLDYSFYI